MTVLGGCLGVWPHRKGRRTRGPAAACHGCRDAGLRAGGPRQQATAGENLNEVGSILGTLVAIPPAPVTIPPCLTPILSRCLNLGAPVVGANVRVLVSLRGGTIAQVGSPVPGICPS